MRKNEIIPEDLASLEIPMEQQKKLVAEIEERIAKGENTEEVVSDVFGRLEQSKQ